MRRGRAVLSGDGDVEDTRDLVRSHGPADRVEVPGWIGPARSTIVLREADVFVLLPFAKIPGIVIALPGAGTLAQILVQRLDLPAQRCDLRYEHTPEYCHRLW
jgi:hypothetical protein